MITLYCCHFSKAVSSALASLGSSSNWVARCWPPRFPRYCVSSVKLFISTARSFSATALDSALNRCFRRPLGQSWFLEIISDCRSKSRTHTLKFHHQSCCSPSNMTHTVKFQRQSCCSPSSMTHTVKFHRQSCCSPSSMISPKRGLSSVSHTLKCHHQSCRKRSLSSMSHTEISPPQLLQINSIAHFEIPPSCFRCVYCRCQYADNHWNCESISQHTGPLVGCHAVGKHNVAWKALQAGNLSNRKSAGMSNAPIIQ